MNKLMLVESLMAQRAEYRDARVVALRDASRMLSDTVEEVSLTVLLDDGRIVNIYNALNDGGEEYFKMNRIDNNPFCANNTWQDFLPSVDVLEWAQATKRMAY